MVELFMHRFEVRVGDANLRHPQAGFSTRRQKGVTFCRAALPEISILVVELFMHRFEVRVGDVGVDLGGRNVAMT